MNTAKEIILHPGDLVFTWKDRKIVLFRFLGYSIRGIEGHMVGPEGLSPERIKFPMGITIVDVVRHLDEGKERWEPPGRNI